MPYRWSYLSNLLNRTSSNTALVESSAAAWAWLYQRERHPEGLATSQGFELLVMIQYHAMQCELAGAISKDHAYTLAI